VKQAKDLGFTEPDPRTDLNGIDVRRKLIILARESGLPLEQASVKIDAILPEACQKAENVAQLFEEIEKADDYFENMRANAAKEGKVLRFIAKLENGEASIVLQAVDASNPFHSLSGSDNMIVFTTDRYKERPLVILGPGAGAEVTAAGVFAEIITIGNFLS
jgi:aspartokinase/homoserine dehydrogenase 1